MIRHMTTQIAVRLDDAQLAALDVEVRTGRAASRSEAIRRSITYLTRTQRYRADDAILTELTERGQEPYPDLTPLHHLPPVALD
jgi:Arc/MetJ-type ribon-helix-helix transcriptional regulator